MLKCSVCGVEVSLEVCQGDEPICYHCDAERCNAAEAADCLDPFEMEDALRREDDLADEAADRYEARMRQWELDDDAIARVEARQQDREQYQLELADVLAADELVNEADDQFEVAVYPPERAEVRFFIVDPEVVRGS